MSIELKAELVMAIRNYECEERQRSNERIDFSASHAESDGKILLRVIEEPETRSGVVGIDAVRDMVETMEHEDYEKGVLISERFSKAAEREMDRRGIQMVSNGCTPLFKPQRLYLTIQDCVDDLCEAKCGHIPEEESDCKGYSEGHYSCKIRRISDDAVFHFERGWGALLQNDLIQLLALQKSMNNRSVVS